MDQLSPFEQTPEHTKSRLQAMGEAIINIARRVPTKVYIAGLAVGAAGR